MNHVTLNSAWQRCRKVPVVFSCLVLFSGCGKLNSFGMAPGETPPPDASAPPPPPPPPTDAGACIDGGLPYSAEDSAEFFDTYVFDSVQSCAFCHFGATQPVMTPPTAHDVMLQRIDTEAPSAAATVAGQIFKLDGAAEYPNHNFTFEAPENAQLWIENHLFGPCTGDGPVTPLPNPDAGQRDVPAPVDAGCEESGELDPNVISQLAVQMSDALYEGFHRADVCTNCHVAPRAQGGFQYVAANKAALTQSLIESGRIEAGQSAANTKLGHYLNLGAPANPVEEATGIHVVASETAGFSTTLRTETTNYLENIAYQLALVSCDPPDDPPPPDVDVPLDVPPPVDVEIVDGGVLDVNIVDAQPDVVVADAGCSPEPYDNAASEAYFAENLLASTRTCATCHYGGVPPAMNDSTAHNVMKDRIDAGAASAAETTAGKYMRVDGALSQGHNHTFSASPQAKIWIDNHLNGVLPEGCE